MANEFARTLRRNKTEAERRLWFELRALKGIGFKFRQQAPIDRFVVDFVCFSRRLIIEVDGATHSSENEMKRDEARDAYLVSQNFKVIRVSNGDVVNNLQGVMDMIVHALNTPTPTPPRKGEGL